eukprot:TRINITY_DN2266_c0_g2_i3.p1 TRINITY_DN2266_c0_g2~~TRINITY_DN2266_c0_g2_i3.p1  ORF type:complete len:1859 (-),score=760.71 TRINITY_DN2266_c0_g2_i3:142-5718(-)
MKRFIFDLIVALRLVFERFPDLDNNAFLKSLLTAKSANLTPAVKKQVLALLVQLLAAPESTRVIARTFRPLLPLLLTELPSLVATTGASSAAYFDSLERISSVFSWLLPVCPQCLGFVLRFFQNSPSLFARLEASDVDFSRGDASPQDTKRLSELLRTAHRFLRLSPTDFAALWNWAPVFALLEHPDTAVRWHAAQCISIYLGASDSTRTKLKEQLKLPEFQFGIPEQEERSLETAALFLNDAADVDAPVREHVMCVTAADLNQHLVDVCGVLLPRKAAPATDDPSNRPPSKFVFTDTSEANMRALALAVSQRHPILMEGVTGAGKTTQIAELATLTGNTDMIKVHLGDQADANVLLGTYVCSDVPGEFKWQPGALTQAVMQGRWIVIEDIDLAPLDVISILIPLLETRRLFIPGRGEVQAHNEFQLFGTQTVARSSSKTQNAALLGNLWTKVVVEPLSAAELTAVLQHTFPALDPLAASFVKTFNMLVQNLDPHARVQPAESSGLAADEELVTPSVEMPADQVSVGSSRYVSLRDLLKWCTRVEALHAGAISASPPGSTTVAAREAIFCEAVDCFSSMMARPSLRHNVIRWIGQFWNLPPDRIEYYIELHKPSLSAAPSAVAVGRVNLAVPEAKAGLKRSRRSNFAHTMHSLRLMEQIGACIRMGESALLVGETGTGKTTVVQYLAQQLGQQLIAVNLSQQSESADLLGGFKPVELRSLCVPLKAEFERLFPKTFSMKKNAEFFERVVRAFELRDWRIFFSGIKKGLSIVENRNAAREKSAAAGKTDEKPVNPQLREQWRQLAATASKFETQAEQITNNFAFSFVEGSLVRAVREGHWVLLDEVNLAPAEAIESLSGLLEGGSVSLTERGDVTPVPRHANFRLFACMNPPTDIGKKELPPGIRNRFTEFFVDELDNKDDLRSVVSSYLKDIAPNITVQMNSVVEFYLEARKLAHTSLADGANHKPHYSLRTLCRALDYAQRVVPDYGFDRALYEGFTMSFMTQLNASSAEIMEKALKKHFAPSVNLKALNKPARKPAQGDWEQVENFWVQRGEQPVADMAHYILTPSIKKHLNNLARIVVANRYPILLQGPTSSGKTSMVEYVAKRTGHRFVRINNHEHTDLQEYLGSYISNAEGKLVFQEGILVEAMRKGYWVVLDELNLAPSEVLEALNRLLDDNRELLIPETQEVVTPHAQFALFATQNPPGLYGGRKVLSKAFRNRFLELHIDEIPEHELEVILEQRCSIPRSFCQKLVLIMKDLQRNRQSTHVFAGKHGYITLRDLFRWAERKPGTYQELADTGFMLLAERLRKDEEKKLIKETIEKHLKATVDLEQLYACDARPEFAALKQELDAQGNPFKIVWTKSIRRLFTLVGECLKHKEPVLLVGETGTGKTTICQLFSVLFRRRLHILNCHQHTETADFLGGLRPVRGKNKLQGEIAARVAQFIAAAAALGLPSAQQRLEAVRASQSFQDVVSRFQETLQDVSKLQPTPDAAASHSALLASGQQLQAACGEVRALFAWYDGPLVDAMKRGELFLIDEISLAEDAVLERLNSVLEPHRLLVLAEKGGLEIEELTGHEDFRIMATMNPGGDFGKKELSPAMRNRFTEIWVPAVGDLEELGQIVENKFAAPQLAGLSKTLLEFMQWFIDRQRSRGALSLRDILSWVDFLNMAVQNLGMDSALAYLHGACMVLLDGLGVGSGAAVAASDALRVECFRRLCEQLPPQVRSVALADPHFTAMVESNPASRALPGPRVEPTDPGGKFGVEPFLVPCGAHRVPKTPYSLTSPTVSHNVLRVLRAMQLPKPILLEGSPGVGKTSLITALAAATGNRVCRINMSEHTDLMDLLGTVPHAVSLQNQL